MEIILENIEKKFNEELLFSKVNYTFRTNTKYALVGANGSGKSTLLQIISGFLSPSKGTIFYTQNNVEINKETIFQYISICAPYLELIEEMTLTEFLKYHFSFKPQLIDTELMIQLANLHHAKNKAIEKFSSGMKQRVKLLQAFMSDTPILLLDEPCSNLDQEGYDFFKKLMTEFCYNKLIIVASNDSQEIALCECLIPISDFKKISNGIKQ